jgi:hypothetical protein
MVTLLIPVHAVCRIIGEKAGHKITRSQLATIYPHLPHVQIVKVRTRCFPDKYIIAYGNYLRNRGLHFGARSARDFAASKEGQRLITAAQDDLRECFYMQTEFTVAEVDSIFNAGRKGVLGWKKKRVIQGSVVRKDGHPTTIFPRGSVESCFEWMLPEV